MTKQSRRFPLRGTTADLGRARRLLSGTDVRVFHPSRAHEAGIFRARKDAAPELLGRMIASNIDAFVGEGALALVRTTDAGRLFRVIAREKRTPPPRTARQRRSAAWQAAERSFQGSPEASCGPATAPPVNPESPVAWLARRRGADGKAFLSRDEVAAAERLRSDFERAQLAPGVSQDWRRFLTAGVGGGRRVSAQEREIGGGASAARDRLSDALAVLGPGLADIAMRVCCFLEGIEAIETSMDWSRRSGKVVLKIALQRLASHYEEVSVRHGSRIETWMPGSEQTSTDAARLTSRPRD